MIKKIVKRSRLFELVDSFKNKKVVTTNGAFDLLHVGHVRCLKFAKEQGDILIVGLNSDGSIKKYKSKKRPIMAENERAEILASLECVDFITIFDEETPIEILEIIKPRIHVKGIEYSDNLIERDVVEKNDGRIIFRTREENEITTTKIIEKIKMLYGK